MFKGCVYRDVCVHIQFIEEMSETYNYKFTMFSLNYTVPLRGK